MDDVVLNISDELLVPAPKLEGRIGGAPVTVLVAHPDGTVTES